MPKGEGYKLCEHIVLCLSGDECCFMNLLLIQFSLDLHFVSYYGLSVWFPDMIKHLQYEEYKTKVKVRLKLIYLIQ